MSGFTEQPIYFRQPAVTIFLPVHNSEKYLRISLESLLRQSFTDYELLIHDSGSRDGTAEICQYYALYDSRIKFFQSSGRLSFSRIFKRMVEAASGKYFLLFSPEHKCSEDYLATCVNVLAKNPKAVFCYTAKNYIDKNEQQLIDFPFFSDFSEFNFKNEPIEKILLSFGEKYDWRLIYGLFNTYILQRNLFFPDFSGGFFVFIFHLLLAGDFIKIPEKLFYHRYIESEISSYSLEKLLRNFQPDQEKFFTRIVREIIKNSQSEIYSETQKAFFKKFLLNFFTAEKSFWQKKLLKENQLTDSEKLKKILKQKNKEKRTEPNFFAEADDQKFKEIYYHLNQKSYSDALLLLEALLKKYPVERCLLSLQAEINFLAKNYEQACKFYRRIFELFPDNGFDFYRGALCFWQKGLIPEALALFHRAAELLPEDKMVNINYFRALDNLGYFAEANALFLSILKNRLDRDGRYQELAERIIFHKVFSPAKNKYPFLLSLILLHNGSESELREKLYLLREQTIAAKMEIIIIDQSGLNKTQKNQLELIFPTLKWLKFQETIYHSWNKAIKKSSGKYLTFYKNNCTYWKDIFADMVDELEANQFVGLVYTDLIITYDSDRDSANYGESDLLVFHDWNRQDFLFNGFPIGLQSMWRKSLHQEYGLLNPEYGEFTDYEFLTRISQTNQVKHLKYFIGFYVDFSLKIEEQEFAKQEKFNQSAIKKTYQSAFRENKILFRRQKIVNISSKKERKRKNFLAKEVYQKHNFYLDQQIFPDFRLLPEDCFYIILFSKANLQEVPVCYFNQVVDQIWIKNLSEKEFLLKRGVSSEKIFVIDAVKPKNGFQEINNILNKLPDKPCRQEIKRYSPEFYFNYAFSLFLSKKYRDAEFHFQKGIALANTDLPEDLLLILLECQKKVYRHPD